MLSSVPAKATVGSVFFSFATQVGMLPLTGTSKVVHMQEDLLFDEVFLCVREVALIEELTER